MIAKPETNNARLGERVSSVTMEEDLWGCTYRL
jgi:hypothetical protein